jgi:hypothetical protein
VTDLMAGEIIAIVMLGLAVAYLISRLMRETPDIVDCGMVHDCDGCDECGAPMVIDEEPETFAVTIQMRSCNGTVVTGGALAHAYDRSCPLHGPSELERLLEGTL